MPVLAGCVLKSSGGDMLGQSLAAHTYAFNMAICTLAVVSAYQRLPRCRRSYSSTLGRTV